VPKTSTELIETMRGFIAFAFTFFILFSIWYRQFTFFRRFGLEDTVAISLNGALLFVVLFFVYPLKFLASWIVGRAMGGGKSVLLANGQLERIVKPEHMPWLFAIYGLGFSAVFTVFALLYRHALTKRDELSLTELELFETKHSVKLYSLVALLGALIALNGTSTVFENSTGPLRFLSYVFLLADVAAIAALVRLRLSGRRQRIAMESRAA
jgi:uncharacterized membrane protein